MKTQHRIVVFIFCLFSLGKNLAQGMVEVSLEDRPSDFVDFETFMEESNEQSDLSCRPNKAVVRKVLFRGEHYLVKFIKVSNDDIRRTHDEMGSHSEMYQADSEVYISKQISLLAEEYRSDLGLFFPQTYFSGKKKFEKKANIPVEGEWAYIVQQYIPGKPLNQWTFTRKPNDLPRHEYEFNLKSFLAVFYQILYALKSAEKVLKFTHGDLHPENIIIAPTQLLQNKNIDRSYVFNQKQISFDSFPAPTLIDFGLSSNYFIKKNSKHHFREWTSCLSKWQVSLNLSTLFIPWRILVEDWDEMTAERESDLVFLHKIFFSVLLHYNMDEFYFYASMHLNMFLLHPIFAEYLSDKISF